MKHITPKVFPNQQNLEILDQKCKDDEFTCKNGQCIPSEWRCDKVKDCQDESDEKKCGKLIGLSSKL